MFTDDERIDSAYEKYRKRLTMTNDDNDEASSDDELAMLPLERIIQRITSADDVRKAENEDRKRSARLRARAYKQVGPLKSVQTVDYCLEHKEKQTKKAILPTSTLIHEKGLVKRGVAGRVGTQESFKTTAQLLGKEMHNVLGVEKVKRWLHMETDFPENVPYKEKEDSVYDNSVADPDYQPPLGSDSESVSIVAPTISHDVKQSNLFASPLISSRPSYNRVLDNSSSFANAGKSKGKKTDQYKVSKKGKVYKRKNAKRKIVCPICNKSNQWITRHLKQAHGICGIDSSNLLQKCEWYRRRESQKSKKIACTVNGCNKIVTRIHTHLRNAHKFLPEEVRIEALKAQAKAAENDVIRYPIATCTESANLQGG